MAKKAVMCDAEMPSHPDAPRKASATQHGTNSFVRGGKGKGKKGRKKHVRK